MKRMIKYAKPYCLHIVVAAIASIGCSVSGVWVIDILKLIVDGAITGNTILYALIVVVIGMLSNYLVVDMTGRFGAGVLKDLRKDALEHIMKASPDFVEKNNFGDIMERLSSDIDGIAGYMKTYFKDCLYVPIIVIVFTVYLVKLNWMLALACLIPLIILVPLSTALLKPVKLSQHEYVRKLGLTNNNIQEVYDAADVIKSYNLQSKVKDKYYKALKETLDISYKNDLRQYNVNPVTMMISEVPVAIALCMSGWMVFEGNITLGMMVAVISAVQKMIAPLNDTYQLVVRTQLAMVSFNRVCYVLDFPVEEQQWEDLEKKGNIAFELRNVSFSYGENKILNNINLVVERGTKVALVGESGSGKSTILKLLCRQYEVGSGSIRCFGNDYKDVAPGAVRTEIALISQDPVLFPMSVFDNIRVGNPRATREQIIEAAKAAECHTFIENMPQGYDTLLHEKGGNLSGGQRQRLSIARAILKDSEVLLLDEPTSALDEETQKNISETLKRIAKGKTVVTVAHRLSTIAGYDKTIVVENGEIIGGECG